MASFSCDVIVMSLETAEDFMFIESRDVLKSFRAAFLSSIGGTTGSGTWLVTTEPAAIPRLC